MLLLFDYFLYLGDVICTINWFFLIYFSLKGSINKSLSERTFIYFVFVSNFPVFNDGLFEVWSLLKLFCVEERDLLLLFSFNPFLKVFDFDFLYEPSYLVGLNGLNINFFGVSSEKAFEIWSFVDFLWFVSLLLFVEFY